MYATYVYTVQYVLYLFSSLSPLFSFESTTLARPNKSNHIFDEMRPRTVCSVLQDDEAGDKQRVRAAMRVRVRKLVDRL